MDPETTIDLRFGDRDAQPTPWSSAKGIPDTAETFWISTVRRDSRPYVTTLLTF